MAYTQNEKSTGLDTLTTLASGDLVIVGDVSDAGRAKAITKANFIADAVTTGLQAGIQFEDETGANLGTAGTADEVELTGNVTGARVGNKVTYTILAGSATNASTTVRGVVQEATQSEVNAGTGTGTTGARLFVNPSTLGAAILNYITTTITTYKELLLKYTVNADESVFSWFTYEAPFLVTSNTTIAGWIDNTNYLYTNDPGGNPYGGAGGNGWFTITAAGQGHIATHVAGTGSDQYYNTIGSKKLRIKFRMKYNGTVGAGDRFAVGMTVTSGNAVYTAFNAVADMAWRIIIDAGTLYLTNANGATATTTNITGGVTIGDWNTYEVVYDFAGTSIQAYINGTLKATHATNLNAGSNSYLQIGTDAQTGTVSAQVSPFVISLEA